MWHWLQWLGRPHGDERVHDGHPGGSIKDIGRTCSIQERSEESMFATGRTTTPRGQVRRQRRSPAILVLASLALCSLLVLLTGCGMRDTGKSAVTAPMA